jgi:hypothetical protein
MAQEPTDYRIPGNVVLFLISLFIYSFKTCHMAFMRRAMIVYLFITNFETFKDNLFPSFKNNIMCL